MKQKYSPSVRGIIRATAVTLLAMACFAVLASYDYPANDDGVAVLSRSGSRGDEVRQIQQKLKQWGYYSGGVDGIYGAKTADAVRAFQKKNGLTVDGVAGPKTLAAMGISSAAGGSGGGDIGNRDNDLKLLARIISAEARGESYNGQVAVGSVIMNRIKHPSFPNTLSGVIYQPGAFTALVDGQFNQPVADSAYRAAQDAMNGMDVTGGAIYYYNPATATNAWIRSRPIVKTIGKHVFCK